VAINAAATTQQTETILGTLVATRHPPASGMRGESKLVQPARSVSRRCHAAIWSATCDGAVEPKLTIRSTALNAPSALRSEAFQPA
jgi:hypothetical protein